MKLADGNVARCPNCTVEDEVTGRLARLKDCTAICRTLDELRGGWPLTTFLVKLGQYSEADLAKADGKKAAKVFNISEAHATGYIALARELRGINHVADA